jgi:hypothetical protein
MQEAALSGLWEAVGDTYVLLVQPWSFNKSEVFWDVRLTFGDECLEMTNQPLSTATYVVVT